MENNNDAMKNMTRLEKTNYILEILCKNLNMTRTTLNPELKALGSEYEDSEVKDK